MLTRNRLLRAAAAAVGVLVLLAACATQGFNERMAGGYSAVSFSRDSAGVLLDVGVIGSAEAQNVQNQAEHFRVALDLTRTIYATDPDTAEAKLTATLIGIDGLRDYLGKLDQAEEGGDE